MTRNRRRILVVDDERTIADLLVLILKGYGWDARSAYGGKAAVAIAPDFAPDVVLSDVAMPDLDGIEACAQIRQSVPHCKVVLFSGQATTKNLLDRARTNGIAAEILAKPIDPQLLVKHLDDLFTAPVYPS